MEADIRTFKMGITALRKHNQYRWHSFLVSSLETSAWLRRSIARSTLGEECEHDLLSYRWTLQGMLYHQFCWNVLWHQLENNFVLRASLRPQVQSDPLREVEFLDGEVLAVWETRLAGTFFKCLPNVHSPHEIISAVCDFPHKIIEKCFR